MVTIPRSTVTGYITVAIKPKQRAAIEARIGRSLSDEHWKTAASICEQYIQNQRHEQAHPDAKEVKKLCGDINKAAKKLLSAVKPITGTNLTSAQEAARVQIGAHLVTLQFPSMVQGPVHDIAIASKLALRAFQAMTEGAKPGPSTSLAMGAFVYTSASLFEEAGGDPKAYWDAYEETGATPFVEFVYGLCECIPRRYRPSSKEALAAQIKRHLDKMRRGKGELSSE